MKTRPRPFVVLLVLLSYLTTTLSGCVTKYVLERRQERETRIKERTNFWSLSAVTSAQIVSGTEVFACVATPDHPLDQACAEALLRKPLAYLGVIGSRRKAERFKQRFLAAGFTEQEIARVESPMGVPIEALTPAEIAVSIVGRLIAVRRRPG